MNLNKRDLKTVCILLPSHFSKYMGGAEYQTKLILEKLIEEGGYEIYYLCRHASLNVVSRGHKVEIIGHAKGLRRFGLFFDALDIYRALKKIKPQIIYQRIGCSYTGIAAYYTKRFGAKLIWHISSDSDLKPFRKSRFEYWLLGKIERLLLGYGIMNAEVIVAQTEYQRSLLKCRYGRKRCMVIPNGHPLPVKAVKKSRKITILWIANLKKLKQPEIFVQLAEALGSEKSIRFEMIGSNHANNKYESLLARINKIRNFSYLGELCQSDVNHRLEKGHILVNTSKYEGFPNTFIQAWMRKVPVVSLNVNPDCILTQHHIGFHSKNFNQMKCDLLQLINNKKLIETMGETGYQYAVTNHISTKMTEHVLAMMS